MDRHPPPLEALLALARHVLGLERLELARVPLLQVERAERALPADLRRGPRRSPELARRAQALVDQLAR